MVGFPLFLALALRQVDAMHAAVVTGVMPLGTAVVAALALRQRPSAGFWACAVLGCALVLGFAAWQGSGRLAPADGLLLLAVLSTSIAYVAGAQVAAVLPAQQVQRTQQPGHGGAAGRHEGGRQLRIARVAHGQARHGQGHGEDHHAQHAQGQAAPGLGHGAVRRWRVAG